jgi:hypothetical protein
MIPSRNLNAGSDDPLRPWCGPAGKPVCSHCGGPFECVLNDPDEELCNDCFAAFRDAHPEITEDEAEERPAHPLDNLMAEMIAAQIALLGGSR